MAPLITRLPAVPDVSGWLGPDGRPSASFVQYLDAFRQLFNGLRGVDVEALIAAGGFLTEVTPQDFASGLVVNLQVVSLEDSTQRLTSSTFPQDSTIPQITEGAEYFAQSFTPASASSSIRIDLSVPAIASISVGGVGLFLSGQANALTARVVPVGGNSVQMSKVVPSWGTTAKTISARYGATANSITLGADVFGASQVCSMIITEYQATPIA